MRSHLIQMNWPDNALMAPSTLAQYWLEPSRSASTSAVIVLIFIWSADLRGHSYWRYYRVCSERVNNTVNLLELKKAIFHFITTFFKLYMKISQTFVINHDKYRNTIWHPTHTCDSLNAPLACTIAVSPSSPCFVSRWASEACFTIRLMPWQ